MNSGVLVKKISFLLAVLLVFPVFAGAQQTFSLSRSFKAGEVDKYRSKMSMTVNGAEVETILEYREKVSKVNKDGSAEVEVTTTSVEIKIMGVVVDTPKLPVMIQKYSKSGLPLGMPTGGQGQARVMDYSRIIGPIMDKLLTVGKEYPLEWIDPKDERNKVTGKIRIETVVNGIAKIIGNYESWNDKTVKNPVKMSITLLMDIASAKPSKIEGTVTNPPKSSETLEVEEGKFVVERLTK